MNDFSTCTKMSRRTETEGLIPKCPVCGSRTLTSRRVRILGWLLILCGIILVGMMGTIMWNLSPSLSHPGEEIAGGSTFTGTAEQASFVLQLFWLVIVFGALCTVNGVWQIAKGKRNIVFMVATLLLAGAIYFTGKETKYVLGDEPAQIQPGA